MLKPFKSNQPYIFILFLVFLTLIFISGCQALSPAPPKSTATDVTLEIVTVPPPPEVTIKVVTLTPTPTAVKPPQVTLEIMTATATSHLAPDAGFAYLHIPPNFQKGMSYATWWQGQYSTPEADQTLDELAATGAEWIALIVTCYQETYLDTEITCDLPRTPTDGDLAHVIQSAHNLGLKVMLKPHIDLNSDPDHWRGNIGQGFTEEQWQAWFNSYQVAITHYAMLAQAHKVEQFSVGTELVGTSQRETDWRQLITVVRKTYDGTLVYASNHGGEEQRITWWDALDYIGVDAYYPLTDKNNPTVAELEAAWEQPIAILETLHNRYKKPIILTEIGYRSVDGANRQPWEWGASGQVDGQEQADSYQAALQSLWGQPWLAGLYWWNWDTFPGQGGPGDTGFTPHNKPAEKVLQTYYQN